MKTMGSKSKYPICVEKLAAFLDGSLPREEMDAIGKLAQNNDILRAMIDLSDSTDESEARNIMDTIPPEMLNLEIPSLDGKCAPDEDDFDSAIIEENTTAFLAKEALMETASQGDMGEESKDFEYPVTESTEAGEVEDESELDEQDEEEEEELDTLDEEEEWETEDEEEEDYDDDQEQEDESLSLNSNDDYPSESDINASFNDE